MIIGGIDIETTGLLDPDHRIVEIYIGIWKNETFVNALNQRIDPERSISADAQRVHGISYQDLIGKPKWPQIAPSVVKLLGAVDYVVWHNGDDFDGPFINMELKRIGLVMPQIKAIDTMVHGVWATPDGKKPNLGELCFATGVDYDPALAHAAEYDVHRMVEAFFAARREGYYPLPEETGISHAA